MLKVSNNSVLGLFGRLVSEKNSFLMLLKNYVFGDKCFSLDMLSTQWWCVLKTLVHKTTSHWSFAHPQIPVERGEGIYSIYNKKWKSIKMDLSGFDWMATMYSFVDDNDDCILIVFWLYSDCLMNWIHRITVETSPQDLFMLSF